MKKFITLFLLSLVTLTAFPLSIQKRTFKAVKYCVLDNGKWGDWKNTEYKVIIEKKIWSDNDYSEYITIRGTKYIAKPQGTDKWICYLNEQPVLNAHLDQRDNGSYVLYLRDANGATCLYLKLDDSNSPAARAKLSLDEWLIGSWEGGDDGYSYIHIYKDYINMRIHRYEAVYTNINDISYYVDEDQIITDLENITINIDRSNECLYFRGEKYKFKSSIPR